MGRYYNGDIEGKFWFAVQSSDSADRFGVTGCETLELYYYFELDDLNDVEAEIANIEKKIGLDNLELITLFFDTNSMYNDEIMEEFSEGLSVLFDKHKSDYADLLLGYKIRNCIIETGSCEFTAEC